MKRCDVPLVVHVPHASRVIPSDIRADILLTDAELEVELERVTDHEVDVLFEPVVALNGVMLVNRYSRLVVDPERFRADEEEPAAAFGAGAVYSKTCDGTLLRDPDRYPILREELLQRYYDPYAAAVQACVQEMLARFGLCLIIDAHSYPPAPLPWEQSPEGDRPQIDFGTDPFHTPTDLLDLLFTGARESGFSVALDSPFAGTYVPTTFYHHERRVKSVMIEVRRDAYRDCSEARRQETFDLVARLLRKAHSWLVDVLPTDV
ncbi:MAG TPA: N-formylglutamate amidohydrolase [Actinomycetota bacterium]|nr:N-formylglutamate amidohydrolase [Actinomycetota bacterium]